MSTTVGVITFPGSLDDKHTLQAVRVAGAQAQPLWHASDQLDHVDAVIVPGGFSYGDYLRTGAIARFAPIMTELIAAAHRGLPVLGICNGFQILCEAGLLPGALTRNTGLHFRCIDQWLTVENNHTAWTSRYTQGANIVIPIKHADGRYVADEATLTELEAENRVVFRYAEKNPNGSLHDIAGITNSRGNVVGLMPHPEHAIDALCGPSTDGLGIFASIAHTAVGDV